MYGIVTKKLNMDEYMKSSLEKYNTPVPRYTSFPPVPSWKGAADLTAILQNIKFFNDLEEGIDLYIHIPFCEQLCWYCGCSRIIKKDKNLGTSYVDFLIKEWQFYLKMIPTLKIHSIHFGGGTPNFLKSFDFEKLLKILSSLFTKNFSGSIEVDPRTLSENFIQVMKEYSFNRVSMGIQDFDIDVQEAMNRIQSVKLIEDLTHRLRENGAQSINFDLIYGLPKQTKRTVHNTIEKVIALAPDLLAYYSYAHLPDSLRNQKLINESDLLFGKEKQELFELGSELLEDAGYIKIGFDHFAKKDSYLANAFLTKKLKRNFMGFTDKKSNCLLGLGASAISSTPDYFWQNEKKLEVYQDKINKNLFQPPKGHALTQREKLTAELIQELMCHNEIDLQPLSNFENYEDILKQYREFEQDGLVRLTGSFLQVTRLGEGYLRNIAEVLDFLRSSSSPVKYSSAL